MLIFLQIQTKIYHVLNNNIISSEILGPHLVWAPRIAGAAGAVVTPLHEWVNSSTQTHLNNQLIPI